jgi:hypothetical protein
MPDGRAIMSKPKHYKRGSGGGRINLRDYAPVRKAWHYADYLTNEIEELKHRGPSKHLAKLRKYLGRTK